MACTFRARAPTPQVPGRGRAEPPDPLPLLCLRAACRGTAGYCYICFFSFRRSTTHPAHTMGTPTLVNFMRAVKSARDGVNQSGEIKNRKEKKNIVTRWIKVQSDKQPTFNTIVLPLSCPKILEAFRRELSFPSGRGARPSSAKWAWAGVGFLPNGVPCPCPFPTIWAPDELLE